MTWELAIWATGVIAVSIAAHAQGQSTLPIDTLTEHVGTSVSGVIDKVQRQPSQQRSVTLGELVKDLGTLSGLENELSDRIEAVAADPAKAFRGGTNGMVMDALNQKLNEIKYQYSVIDRRIRNIDPEWSLQNASLQIDIGDFAHDGALYYCIITCHTEYFTGGPGIIITQPQEAKRLAFALRQDVKKIKDIAANLQVAGTASTVPAQLIGGAMREDLIGGISNAILLAVIIAVIFFLMLIIFALIIYLTQRPAPDIVMIILRAILALMGGAFAGILGGQLALSFNFYAIAGQATAGIAVAILLYRVNPPGRIEEMRQKLEGDNSKGLQFKGNHNKIDIS